MSIKMCIGHAKRKTGRVAALQGAANSQQRSYGDLEKVAEGSYKATFFDIQGGEGFVVYGLGLIKDDDIEFRYASGGQVGAKELGTVEWKEVREELTKPNRFKLNGAFYDVNFKEWAAFPIKENGDVIGYFLTVDRMAIVDKSGNLVYFSNSPNFSDLTGAGGAGGAGGGGSGGGGS